ncbi:hypothetical protein F4778DRAFT_564404 [Xylariomycetidae sp. FL2044]|nr:hypothetical protein F4778DRAFT_564404 [Xylariomycetidae sp. FL2044]
MEGYTTTTRCYISGDFYYVPHLRILSGNPRHPLPPRSKHLTVDQKSTNSVMKLILGLFSLLTATALGQTFPECTRELAATDDCADVINANACYNKFRFTGTQTLTCIGGTDQADKIRKACQCCSCVGAVMCNWVQTQRFQC